MVEDEILSSTVEDNLKAVRYLMISCRGAFPSSIQDKRIQAMLLILEDSKTYTRTYHETKIIDELIKEIKDYDESGYGDGRYFRGDIKYNYDELGKILYKGKTD